MARPAVPIYAINPDEVDEAYEAYSALRRAAQDEPSLIENKYWQALQETAYARFLMNFKAMK